MSVASESMRAYRAVWLVVCAAFAVVGVSSAVYAAPTRWAVLSGLSCLAAIIWSLLLAPYRRLSRGPRARLVLTAALAGGTAGGAFAGFAVVFGVGVVVVVLALLGSAPFTLRACARGLRAAWASWGDHFDAAGSALAYTGLGFVPIERGDDLCLITDEQLCEAWRTSTTALHGASPRRMKSLVEQRQRYLDEFERRNPKGVKVWLASTDTSAGDPGVYLVERWVDLPTADWDELTRGQGA